MIFPRNEKLIAANDPEWQRAEDELMTYLDKLSLKYAIPAEETADMKCRVMCYASARAIAGFHAGKIPAKSYDGPERRQSKSPVQLALQKGAR